MPEKLKLLMCSPFPLERRFGAPKVLIELAEAMAVYGWDITLVAQEEMLESLRKMGIEVADNYPENLRRYLREVAGRYDVVDFDHEYLPFPRNEFSPTSLMVARSVLFALHHRRIEIPRLRRRRDVVRDWFRRERPASISEERITRIEESLRQADLINVSNTQDLAEIRRCSLGEEKTCVFPYGFRPRSGLEKDTPVPPLPVPPRIAFVGSYDERKGGTDLPSIFVQIAAAIPGVQFRLLGTGGVFQTAREVKSFFPRALRPAIEVIPFYDPEELPGLLSDCSAGVFPSYLEGFAFAIVEMTAVGLPVLAYDAPGAGDILPEEALVPIGAREEIAARMIQWLQNPEKLVQARNAAKVRGAHFNWDRIAKETDGLYREALEKLRGARVAS